MSDACQRFAIVDGSQSGHGCCFQYTVVDTTKPMYLRCDRVQIFESVCECLEKPDAVMICDALNVHPERRS